MSYSNERARNLVRAPMPVAPRTPLKTVRDINKAIDRNVNGGNYGVYCSLNGEKNCSYVHLVHRVFHARTVRGVLQVKCQSGWLVPSHVWVEG
ncbi:hypothetical protein [Dictyobacter kobayashii]|uniref:Uncharacterized protein n=1 Tax=Dictyobacter kobayashii TaxID=2014872 RepID=A0A402AMP8_9CHLR|nr:hypothetical protein [Dictyobacter kobayashii]GCE20362.1 hypothetical protein KDK_41620 [Dictyobacter kobayashii]